MSPKEITVSLYADCRGLMRDLKVVRSQVPSITSCRRPKNKPNYLPALVESSLVESLGAHLISKGYSVFVEVSNMGQSVDVVALKDGRRTMIEAKLHSWKRALEQCKAHKLVGDYIVIAMPMRKNIPTALTGALRKNGWGLLTFDPFKDEWKWTVRPRLNRRGIWRPQQERFDKLLLTLTPEANQ